MCTALGTAPPECIVKPDCNNGLHPTVEFIAIHCLEVEDRQVQIEDLIKVSKVEA